MNNGQTPRRANPSLALCSIEDKQTQWSLPVATCCFSNSRDFMKSSYPKKVIIRSNLQRDLALNAYKLRPITGRSLLTAPQTISKSSSVL